MDMNIVYDFLDYREFLSAYCEARKQEDKKYSHRYFALKLGVKSTGFVSEVLSGKRNLSQNNILQWFKILRFDKDQGNYFESMVHFNQAATLSEKDYWLKKMMECKRVNLKLLNKDEYEYFSKWYYTAMREMLFFYKEPLDYKKVGSMLNPPVAPQNVSIAFHLLERLGMIEKTFDGSYVQKDALISTGSKIKSVQVANFQLQMLDLAKNASLEIAACNRDFSTLSMSISENGFKKITECLSKTRKEIAQITRNDSNEDRVYQLNIQLFPLTKL